MKFLQKNTSVSIPLETKENDVFKFLKTIFFHKIAICWLLLLLFSSNQYAFGSNTSLKKQDNITSLFSKSIQSLQQQVNNQLSDYQLSLSQKSKDNSAKNSNSTTYSFASMMDCNTELSGIDITYTTYVECGDGGLIGFSADVGTLVDFQAAITLPSDFIYAGNVMGATVVSTSPLVLAPTVVGEAIDFSFDIQAQCDASDNGIIDFDFTYTGGGSMCSQSTIAIPTDDVAISIAAPGTPGRNTDSDIIAVLNEQDSLRTTVVQEGLGAIDSLFYFVEAHPLMTLDGLIDCSTGEMLSEVTTIGDRTYFYIGVNQVGPDGFVRNEGIDICQLWTLHTCPSGVADPISYGVVTSCTLDPNDICAEEMYDTPIDFEGRQPQIAQIIDSSIDYDPTCIDAPIKQAWRLVNVGEGPASDIIINLVGKGGNTPMDMTSIVYKIGASGTFQPLDAGSIINIGAAISGCTAGAYSNSGDLSSGMNLSFSNVDLAVGETIFFEYDVYPTACGCGGCDVPRRLGTAISAIRVTDLCDNDVQTGLIVQDQAWPYFDVNMGSFMESPVSNCAGETSTLDVTVTSYLNTFINNQGHGDPEERNAVYFNKNGACTDCYLT